MILGRKHCHAARGILVVDVSKAKVPGVVRLDLSGASFSHFHVRSDQQGSTLGFSDSEGRFTSVAIFADRAEADHVLASIRARLLRPKYQLGHSLLHGITVLFALGFIVIVLLTLISNASAPRVAPVSAAAPAPEAGMPTDAGNRLAPPGD